MNDERAPRSKCGLTFCSAAPDGSLYVAGVVNELEDRDVKHTIIWECIAGEWKRYQWNNRTYAMATYTHASTPVTAYLGYEGTLKVRGQASGSSVEVLEASDDAPSSLRSVRCIRVIGEHLYVVGMRRMVYRRALTDSTWARFDDGVRQSRMAPISDIAGFSSIDGEDGSDLFAVGLKGEIWRHGGDRPGWTKVDSPTDRILSTVRSVPGMGVVVGGRDGTLFVGHDRLAPVEHAFADEDFSCIEHWGGRCFVISTAGKCFELDLDGTPALTPSHIDGMPSVTWAAATPERIYFLNHTTITSLGRDGWRDESPPQSLLA